MSEFSVTVLITREEYAAMHRAAAQKRGVSFAFIVGAVFMAAAGALYLTAQSVAACGLCLILGLCLCLWDGVIVPSAAGALAAREYDGIYGGKMAQTAVFGGDFVTVRTPRAEGVLPLSAVTRAVISKAGVQLDFGREVSLFLPARSLTEEQTAALAHLG